MILFYIYLIKLIFKLINFLIICPKILIDKNDNI